MNDEEGERHGPLESPSGHLHHKERTNQFSTTANRQTGREEGKRAGTQAGRRASFLDFGFYSVLYGASFQPESLWLVRENGDYSGHPGIDRSISLRGVMGGMKVCCVLDLSQTHYILPKISGGASPGQ